MKTTLRTATFALFAASALLAGCAADETADDDAADVVETDDGKADAVRPLGTFTSDSAPAGQFVSLTLNANKTYEAQHQIYCITTPCIPPTETGTYKYTSSGSTKYLRLTKSDGSDGGRYAYTFSGDTLKYRKTNTTTWYTLKRDTHSVPPYCGGVGETRPRGGCPTGYDCNCPNGAMCFVAGTCQPKTCIQNVLCVQGSHFDNTPGVCKCVPDTCVQNVFCVQGSHFDNTPGVCKCVPNACVQNVLCVQGSHFDNTPGVCKCVPNGPACGTTFCAVGDVCCNPLMNICTKPGQFCIQ